MDRLRTLSSHLPSVISDKLPGNPHYYYKTGQTDDGSHVPLNQFPPPEWSQSSQQQPVYPNSDARPTYNAPPLDDRRGSDTLQSPFVLGPATPVARPVRWTPGPLKLPFIVAVAIVMILLAIGVEVAYFEAIRRNGFPVSSHIDPQYLVSFVPVALVAPLAVYWKATDHEIVRIQPYITASHGDAPAESSVLLDYPNQSRIRLFSNSLRYGHRLVFISGLIALATQIFQPLTAAVFVVRSTLYIMPTQPVTSMTTLGLRSDFNDLVAFAAASGYVDAAVSHDLGDPPFIFGGWSVAQFDYKTLYNTVAKNGSVSVNTVATQTDTRCSAVDTITQQGTSSSWTGSYDGCTASFSIQSNDTTETNFGVVRVDNCAVNGATPSDAFKPVMFWFYGPQGQTAMTFCSPTIKAFNVNATLTLFNNTLTNVTVLSDYDTTSNVTSGPPLNGLALNGIFFEASNDKFVMARNTAIQSAVPGAIFRAAQGQESDMNQIFSNSSFLSGLTKKTYTQYLATAGQTNFFLPQQTESSASIRAWQPRIWLNTFATHAFAAIFILIALASLALHIRHTRERKWLFLAGPVGSIASAVSLTSSARFAGLLNAGDTEKSLKEKLEGMYFGIDKDTWQIVVEKDERHQLATMTYSEDRKGEQKWRSGKQNHRMSVVSVASLNSPSVVGTMQHPTTVAAEEITSGRRPSSVATPLTGTFSMQPASPSPYNPQASVIYSPPIGQPAARNSVTATTYQDPYTR